MADPPATPAGRDLDAGRAVAAAAEHVEVVTADGTVERVVAREVMRRDRLRHRCTYIVVLDGHDQVVVHRRAAWKDVWPDRWDIAFGGVVGVGEPWAVAAARELAEEAGVHVAADALAELARGTYDDDAVSVLGRVYLARTDGPFTFPDGEVAEDARVPLVALPAWLEGRATCPDSVALALGPLGNLAAMGNPRARS